MTTAANKLPHKATLSIDSLAHVGLASWITDMIALCKPDRVHLCDGSQSEFDTLCAEMVESGTLLRLNPELRPNSFLARSDASDVARVEDRNFHLLGQ